ncbi:MAG: copper chaperone PCu(A)C [Beijerinckiaceae bacterium]|jgi:copper(I)-binding protein
MKQLVTTVALIAFGLFLAASPARAAEQAASAITVKDAWIRATPNGAKVAGGYATITNTGTVADRLTGAAIPQAPKAEIHEMSMENGVMRMRELDKGLEIPAGGTVTLQPRGFHIMFLNPTAPLKEGDTVSGTLTFEKAGTVPVTFAVTGYGTKAAPGAGDHMHMDMK